MQKYFENKLLGFFVKTNGYFSKKIFSGIGHIVTLHRVLPESNFTIPENKALEITPSTLENLILFYIKKDYEFVTLDTLYDIICKRIKKEKKVVVLTFDDGYSDVYDHAYPILQKFNVPLNLYLTTSFPDNKALLWWYLVDELVCNKKTVSFEINRELVKFDCETVDEKQKVFTYFRNLIFANYNNYKNILENIFTQYDIDIRFINKKNALNWEQIIEMSKNPLVSIGAHTLTHPIFNKLTKEEIIDEVLGSKKVIEEQIKKEVNHFAYPYGGSNEVGKREFEILKSLNFRTCTTTRLSNIFNGHSKHLENLPRISFNENTKPEDLKNLILGITQYNRHKFKRIVTE